MSFKAVFPKRYGSKAMSVIKLWAGMVVVTLTLGIPVAFAADEYQQEVPQDPALQQIPDPDPALNLPDNPPVTDTGSAPQQPMDGSGADPGFNPSPVEQNLAPAPTMDPTISGDQSGQSIPPDTTNEPIQLNQSYGPTKKGDTLRVVANNMRRDNQITVQQMMLAVYYANKHAFVNENMGQLKPKQILRYPTPEELAAVQKVNVAAEIRKYTRSPANRDSGANLIAKVEKTRQENDKQNEVNKRLKTTLQELEDRLQELTKIHEQKDKQLKELKAKAGSR